MVVDSELERRGSLILGLSMILSAIAMYAVVMPALLKLGDECILLMPLVFLCALFGCPILATIFLLIMTPITKLLSKYNS
jgi:hypothetical protein